VRTQKSQVKTMLAEFFYAKGFIHHELWADWTNSQPSLPFGSTEKAARKVRPK
jgi:hypothetical protein